MKDEKYYEPRVNFRSKMGREKQGSKMEGDDIGTAALAGAEISGLHFYLWDCFLCIKI